MAETARKDIWDILKSAATSLSLVAVPLVAAWIGAGFNTATKEAEIRLRTVEIAVGILETNPDSEEDSALRDWAIDVVDQFSGVPIPASAREELQRERLPAAAARRDLPRAEGTEFETEFELDVGESYEFARANGLIEVRLVEVVGRRAWANINVTADAQSVMRVRFAFEPEYRRAIGNSDCLLGIRETTEQSASFYAVCGPSEYLRSRFSR